jgi:glycosyltransferase involved in cell wall biosynthesis
MKILFTRFPLESARGGAEIQTISLMEGLRKRGHAVAFLGSCPTLLALCRERGIPAAELHIGPPPVTKWGAISFFWRKQRMQWKLARAMSSFRDIDAVCMLSLSEKLLLTPLLKGKVLWIEHDSVGPWLTRNPWFPRLRALSRQATTITVSELSRQIYLDLGWNPNKTIAIPNGIDLSRFHSSTETQRGTTALHVGCLSRLSPEKGLDLLITAVQSIPNATLTIVGKGKEAQRLRSLMNNSANRQALTADRSSNIQLLPHIPDPSSFYRSLDIFVLPSRTNDPFGLVAAEAMACGVPVVVTDACGIAGYLKNGTDAIVVKAGDADALRDGIERLRDPAVRKRIGEEGKRTAETAFSAEIMTARYEALLKS